MILSSIEAAPFSCKFIEEEPKKAILYRFKSKKEVKQIKYL
jgi:hypothetical protein